MYIYVVGAFQLGKYEQMGLRLGHADLFRGKK